jgi:phage replication-related protein YjqB (UPF0714/DUF867 family)
LRRDKYKNFDDLRRHEREGVDFAIRIKRRRASAAVIAPHGGKIELGTSKIAIATAADAYSSYCFEGLKRRMNRDLHITSTNFDEPRCLKLISRCDIVVAMHGLDGARERIDIGGRDKGLRNRIRANLQRAGFKARVVTRGTHAAVSRRNICNRGRSGAGAQLEITRGLRDALRTSKARLANFADAVQQAIEMKPTKEIQ